MNGAPQGIPYQVVGPESDGEAGFGAGCFVHALELWVSSLRCVLCFCVPSLEYDTFGPLHSLPVSPPV